MKHISLYRKWRPGVFNEVIGQGRVTDTLMNALTSGRVVHAYLFSGPRGTGKTSTARILAKAINCAEGPTAKPCGVCEACVSISEGTALDVIEIDAASNRKIDEMRDLLDKIPYRPTSLRTKVYIVDEAHQLTNEASSALLKTLEEPPGHVVFILATTEPHKLLPTIVSRCQKYDFSLVSAREISRLLEHIASREEIDIETDALGMIAEHARGSVRDAIGVMDQISNMSGEHITSKQLAEMLGEVEIDLVFETVDFIIDRDTPGVLTLIGKMIEDGKAPRRFVESLIGHLRSLFLVQNAANPSQIVEATEEHYARLAEQANRLRRHEVIRLIERLGDTHREMRQSENPRLVLECALVKITSLDADATLAGLAFRLDELERKIEESGRGASRAGRESPKASPDSIRVKEKKHAGEAAMGARQRTKDVEEGEKAVSEPPVSSGSRAEREKARRAWMAVLAELKNVGQMKLYALLTKAKIVSCSSGELVLGFGEDSAFQMEALKGSGDLVKIAETWERFVGEQVKVRLESVPASASAVVDTGEASSPSSPSRSVAAPGEKQKEAPTENKNLVEMAQLVKERFDGKIMKESGEEKK